MIIRYSNDGHSMRDVSPLAIDIRDIGGDGRPHHSLIAAGRRIGEVADPKGAVTHHLFDHVVAAPLGPGEREFDHVLTDAEIEREFPGYQARLAARHRIGALRKAAAMAAYDDDMARMVKDGLLKTAEISDHLAGINERLKLRGMTLIEAPS